MKQSLFLFILFVYTSGYGQNYNAFEELSGYFANKERLNSCSVDIEIKKKKDNKILNYEIANSLAGEDLIFIHITGSASHNPITPCRMIADSTSKYGYYFVTLEELNKKQNPNGCQNTWIPPINNTEFKIFRKECFDSLVRNILENGR